MRRKQTLIFSLLLVLAGCQMPEAGDLSYFTGPEETMSRQSSSRYVTFLNAAESGAVESGHLPPWVPSSATGIQETHSVDTVQRLLSFAFDPADRESMTGTCHATAAEDVQFPALDADWWDPRLRSAEGAAGSDFTLYECPDEMGYLAVSPSGKAYFWVP